jgi:hypothetical protein
MATYRLIYQGAGTGDRISSLSHLEFRVWVQYQLTADDYGVCPAEAVKLQGDNVALQQESSRRVQAAIERLIAVQLCGVFQDGRRRYLYQPDWQDRQKIRHFTATSYPPISAEELPKCSAKTQEIFRERFRNNPEVFRLHARACDAAAYDHDPDHDPAPGGVGGTRIGPTPHAPGLIRSPLEVARAQQRCAFVGARLEVPKKLHADLVRDTGGMDADGRLRAWYAALDAEIETTGEPIVPDIWKWLTRRWRAWALSAHPASASGIPGAAETRRQMAAIRARAGR